VHNEAPSAAVRVSNPVVHDRSVFHYVVTIWRLVAVLPFIIIFLAMDVFLATLACMLEREPMRGLRVG